MRRPLARLLAKFTGRRAPAPAEPSETAPDQRADELRRKLAESRALVDERESFEGAEPTVDQTEHAPDDPDRRRHAPDDPDRRRHEIHDAGRLIAREMRGRR